MSVILQRLEPPITLDTPKGKAEAYFILDYSYDADTFWGCFMRESREFWWFHNKDIRIEQNITIGRLKA
jgi:hypothetical protein